MTVAVEDRVLDGPHGDLPVRIYEPEGGRRAGLVWSHGGAMAYGDLDMPEADHTARVLAAAGIAVVSVGYRLAPVPEAWGEDPRPGVHYPVASEEVTAAFRWAAGTGLGVARERWSFGGASAGANLTAGAAMRLRDEGDAPPRSLVLVYPLVHRTLPAPTAELAAKVAELPDGARFDPETVLRFNRNYVGHDGEPDSPYAFPGGQDLAGLPPTLVLNSDADSLRASGQAFAAELAAAGVDVLQLREDGTRHGHLDEPDHPGCARSLARIIAWLTSTELVGVPHETSASEGPSS